MATRPIYIPQLNQMSEFVKSKEISFHWYPGMAKSQKQKSIQALHLSAEEDGILKDKILEISSKSENSLGVALSAFNLRLFLPNFKNRITVECLFQGSKVFEGGGPYSDLYEKSSFEAKTDSRLKNSGNLIYFSLAESIWPIEPKTAFYDWLYLFALNQNQELADLLLEYDACTDIEFNPKKSINCQAYTAALYISLTKRGLLKRVLSSPEIFREFFSKTNKDHDQGGLF